mgnify:CR=1 FL=1
MDTTYKYTKKTIDDYLERVAADRLSAEVALVNYRNKLKEVEVNKKKVSEKDKKIRKDLAELKEKVKNGSKEKIQREQNKELLKIVEGKEQANVNEYTNLLERENNIREKIHLYEDFLETADDSVEIAKDMVKNRV